MLAELVNNWYFEGFILLIIFISTITMAIDSPLNDPNGKLSQVLDILDIVITAFFICESLIKIIVHGLLLNGPDSYLRVSWNIMDFIIIIFSLISIIFSKFNIEFIKVIRMLRVLRPLRLISRNDGLKIAVISLINAIPSIINVLIIALLFFVLFAIFGTTYFKGRFYSCLKDNIASFYPTETIVNKWDCLNGGGDWINEIINFDNVLNSMAALFILSSTEGWGDIMFQGIAASDIDVDPVLYNNMGWAAFFMLFMIVGSLFMLNLFVSIVVNTYYSEKEKLYQNDKLSKD
jgi:voltage-dependent calcium channel T type alpha-1G